MGEVYLSKDITLPTEEDGDSVFLGKIKLEDLQSKSLACQLEQECDSLLKQNFIKESESGVGLDEILDSVDIVEDELDEGFSRRLGISEVFWKKVLKLLGFINEAFGLNLYLKLTDDLILTKEKQKRKSLLFSFLDAIRKKFSKKELTLEEMLELQMKALEEQLGSENDPEVVHQIKKQLEFLIELKAKLFELSLEQELNRTTEWLFTIGAMQAVVEMTSGSYKSKEIAITKGQWQKVDSLSNSGKFVRQFGNATYSNGSVENIRSGPFVSTDQNNNFNLIFSSQSTTKDDSGFLRLLYMLLLLVNTYYPVKHTELGIGNDKEAKTHRANQKGSIVNKVDGQKRVPMIQNGTVELQGGQVFFNISKSQNAELRRETLTARNNNNIPSSELKEPEIQVINNSKAYLER